MSNEELVAEIQRGRTDLMEQLWEQVKTFVYWKAKVAMARIPPGRGCTVEDLKQSGYLALASAVETHDPERGSFLAWLSYYLKTEFAIVGGYYGTKQHPLNEAASLDAPLSHSDVGDEGTLHDIVTSERAGGGDAYADVEDAIYREQLHTALDRAMDRIPPEQAEVLRGRYWRGKGSYELAEEHGISADQVQRYAHAGLRALRSPSVSYELRRFLNDHIDYYRNVGLSQFQATGSSSVENTVVRRESLEQQWISQKIRNKAG